jgi:hypothetical protein
MPKVVLSIPLKYVDIIIRAVSCYKIQEKYSPYIEPFETKIFWEAYDAIMLEYPIWIKDEWDKEVEIFNGYDVVWQQNIES